ncbi:MAG: sigma-70 family RNA polymerase sigma factor [Verrucomicrobiales bacterium]
MNHDVTQVLQAIGDGDQMASDELLPLVYNELRKLAASKMAYEAEGHTLQATALVHEAYIKLVDCSQQQDWNSRNHFFMAAAESMRRILIDRARTKSRQKRGGGWQRLELEGLELAMDAQPETLVMLHEVLERFEKKDEIKAQVVKLKFYAGLTNEEVADTLNVSVPTVKRYWSYARAWLMREIERMSEEGSDQPENS